MLKSKIKCHRIGNTYNQPHFFILSKGRNSGKPLPSYCANCFVFVADDEDEKWHFFNLCHALWQGKFFHRLLVGSVIEFIRIDEFAVALHHVNINISQNKNDFKQQLDYIHQLNKHELNLRQQIKLIHQVKQCLVHQMLKARQ